MRGNFTRPLLEMFGTDEATRTLIHSTAQAVGFDTWANAESDLAAARVWMERPALAGLVVDLRTDASGRLRFVQDVRRWHPTVPMLCLASEGDEETRARALELGVRAVVFEPVTADEFVAGLSATFPLLMRRTELVPIEREILALDPDPAAQAAIEAAAHDIGYACVFVETLAHLEKELRDSEHWDGVVLDPCVEDSRGFEFVRLRRDLWPAFPVLCYTHASPLFTSGRHEACGVRDFLFKPGDSRDLSSALRSLLPLTFHGVLTDPALAHVWAADPKWLQLLDDAACIGDADALIIAQSAGDRRELAHAIHAHSAPDRRFVEIQAARSICTSALASEIRRGMSDVGTIFVDGLHELEDGDWGTLTSWLWEVGPSVRIVSGTAYRLDPHGFPAAESARGLLFRCRLNVMHVPPLRERPLDVLLLAEFYREQANLVFRRHTRRFEPWARRRLQLHPYLGGREELRSMVFAAVEKTTGAVVLPNSLYAELSAAESAQLALAADHGSTV